MFAAQSLLMRAHPRAAVHETSAGWVQFLVLSSVQQQNASPIANTTTAAMAEPLQNNMMQHAPTMHQVACCHQVQTRVVTCMHIGTCSTRSSFRMGVQHLVPAWQDWLSHSIWYGDTGQHIRTFTNVASCCNKTTQSAFARAAYRCINAASS
jgi:hypothetical protein